MPRRLSADPSNPFEIGAIKRAVRRLEHPDFVRVRSSSGTAPQVSGETNCSIRRA
jgi:hypothetical protein